MSCDGGKSQNKSPGKRRQKNPANPLRKGIRALCVRWGVRLADFPGAVSEIEVLNVKTSEAALSLSDLPKRYTIYPPLLLLP